MAKPVSSHGGGVFSVRETEYLESLPAVEKVVNGRIVYSEAFKRECVRRYRAGESPVEIFRRSGLDSSLIGYKRIERCIARWKRSERLNSGSGVVMERSEFDVPPSQRWKTTTPVNREQWGSGYIDDSSESPLITGQFGSGGGV